VRLVALPILTIGLAACAAVQLAPTPELAEMKVAEVLARRQAWGDAGVDDYTLELTFLCECRMAGAMEVLVTDGVPVGAMTARGPLANDELARLPISLDRLFDQAVSDLNAGGSVRATWDVSGLPRHIILDPIPNAIDDELDVTIDGFEPTT
jgi:hypothetical protein